MRSAITSGLQKIWALYATVSLVALMASSFVETKKVLMEDETGPIPESADNSEEHPGNVKTRLERNLDKRGKFCRFAA